MKTSDLASRESCTGCKACAYVCPKQAIFFEKDKMGFEYPVIDNALCIDCGKCVRTCPVEKPLLREGISAFAAVNKNHSRLNRSASGGVFAAIADDVLSCGGSVYGASMDQDEYAILKVSHVRIDDPRELHRLQGSKYLQSDMGDIYAYIRKDLRDGREVLFCGTPCQTAAVRAVFGEQEHFLLVDIICHGVPSQQLFSDYLNMLQQKRRSAKIESFRFRTKESGWGLCAQLETKNAAGAVKRTRIPCHISSYYMMFLHCEIYRESCYSCRYAQQKRVSDLTLGDYWGVEKIRDVYKALQENQVDITKGVSCVIASTQKGLGHLQRADLLLIPSDYESLAKENGQLKHPSPQPESRQTVLDTYAREGYQTLEKRHDQALGVKKYLILLRNRIPPQIRMKVKQLLRK